MPIGSSPSSITTYVDLAAASANQTIVAAPGANLAIWVTNIHIQAAAAGTLRLHDSTPTNLSGTISLAATGGFAREASNPDLPLYKCAANTAFQATTVGAGATMDGSVGYIVVRA